MRSLLRRRRRRSGTSRPAAQPDTSADARAELLERLDAVAAEGGHWAHHAARDIRENGQPALERHMGTAAAHVVEVKALVRLDPVVSAFAAYDLAANGHDWAAIPGEHERWRRDASAPQERLQAAYAARQQRLARMQENYERRQLAAVRASAR